MALCFLYNLLYIYLYIVYSFERPSLYSQESLCDLLLTNYYIILTIVLYLFFDWMIWDIYNGNPSQSPYCTFIACRVSVLIMLK